MPVHVEMRVVGLAPGLQQRGRVLHEGHAELMRTGRDRNANLQMLIDQLVVLVALSAARP